MAVIEVDVIEGFYCISNSHVAMPLSVVSDRRGDLIRIKRRTKPLLSNSRTEPRLKILGWCLGPDKSDRCSLTDMLLGIVGRLLLLKRALRKYK